MSLNRLWPSKNGHPTKPPAQQTTSWPDSCSLCTSAGMLPVTGSWHAQRDTHAAPAVLLPACCQQGWPATGAPARLGVVPVADAAQEVHSRRCCGTIAFEFPTKVVTETFIRRGEGSRLHDVSYTLFPASLPSQTSHVPRRIVCMQGTSMGG
jgi:hypothetical protein